MAAPNSKIQIGSRLCTKDGRRIGNGIVVAKDYKRSKIMKQSIWKVVTDFGNSAKMTKEEIVSLWYVMPKTDVVRWLSDRSGDEFFGTIMSGSALPLHHDGL